ncbi:MAG: tetratricopeptide repeat protein, partial [Acidobacteria bacterium]|nr:tetratricopeptide repeat protein [Acidobacteriota bacterium]
MENSGANTPDPEECREQLRKILESRTFRGSEALRNLLAFLVGWSLKSPETPPKEYVIATEVLGRPEDFDPHADPAVRVQVGRLRSKLTDYY